MGGMCCTMTIGHGKVGRQLAKDFGEGIGPAGRCADREHADRARSDAGRGRRGRSTDGRRTCDDASSPSRRRPVADAGRREP